MKIQDLAIIFVIIIFPISLVLSAYAQYQIQTLNTQTLYDTQLTAATYDAIKAYQINAENSTTSELANSKIRDIEASISTFRNSIMSAFRLNGYTEEELDNYIPALVYTMYDGFYIYSPYGNSVDENGNPNLDGDHTTQYGLKPYIPYSCRYKKGSTDIVITYSLDNYITIQGTTNGVDYINESGYLIDGIQINGERVTYNDIEIQKEKLQEYLPIPRKDSIPAGESAIPDSYSYVKINGTKYYNVDMDPDIPGYDTIIYLLNGSIAVQCKKNDSEYTKYENLINENDQAIQYYKKAKIFTDKVRSILNGLTYNDAYDVDEMQQIWPGDTTPIFETSTINIENELSNFNQHRLSVIRHVIESNLSIAIANYNKYSGATNEFQMPKLKENEWDYITHNISLISFLQGLNIGGKIYNGYTIVTNSESKEVVLESNIYILGTDGDYHKIGDKTIEGSSGEIKIGDSIYGSAKSAGRVNLDFKRKIITNNNNSRYYYPLQAYNASYESIIMQENVTTYDDIYDYVKKQKDSGNKNLAQAFYTALGRERESQYKSNYIMNF